MSKSSIVKGLALSLLLAVTCQSTVTAGENISSKLLHPDKYIQKGEHKCCPKGSKNHHYLRASLKILSNKYGFTKEDFQKAKESGKTVFDLAKQKGLTADQLKSMIVSPKLKAIDEMMATGELSKEKGEELKAKMTEGLKDWDGKIEDFKDKDKDKD